VVAALAKRGLLRIVAAEDDRRRARISLTAKGEALTRELQRTAAEVRAALVDGLGRDEEAALRQALKKVTGNLERYIARSGRRT
jgi:DNA-binding MarR family transcriptional regulator